MMMMGSPSLLDSVDFILNENQKQREGERLDKFNVDLSISETGSLSGNKAFYNLLCLQ